MKKTLTLLLALWVTLAATAASADSLTCWFPPDWKDNQAKAKTITDALSANAGVTVRPRIAKDYPEILAAFATREPNLVYAGSFVQSIISARKLGTPMVQSADGKEMYSGILICSKDRKPEDILRQTPQQVAFARGASSGESTAKAATAGKASLAVASHGEAVKAVLDGKAQGAVVKDWWWLKNEANYPNLKSYRIPALSEQRNPDNVLAASGAVPKATVDKLTMAAMASSAAFGQQSVVLPFTTDQLSFSLGLMKKGGIDPLTYSW
jgi:ABC-type phosphate/phosphonate transport system substrate-binding protein